MRIIAGSARGRRILSVPKKMGLRPISSRMRQSLFDILRPRVMGSRFLDLFAGTGAVGLEALSRGAESAVFVDIDQRCVRVVERNLERAGWAARGKAFRANALAPLSWISYRSGVERFDLIYLGPPYWEAPASPGASGPAKERSKPLRVTQEVLANIASAGILEPEGWIAAQHQIRESPEAPEGFERFRQSRYGDTIISFFRRAGRPRSPLASQ